MNTTMPTDRDTGYELRFQSLFSEGRGYAFPCDAQGRVDLDRLGDKLRLNYLFVRAVVGRDYGLPVVQPRPAVH